MKSNNETISLIWCDNGTTEGKFTEGLVQTLLASNGLNIPIITFLRVTGVNIAVQRQRALNAWEQNETDWALWVDSDIVLTPESLQTLWDCADKESKPIVSGVYFISNTYESNKFVPKPCLYRFTTSKYKYTHVYPLLYNKEIKIDACGMGFILMHKSVVKKLKEKFGQDAFLFKENQELGDKFIGEDISFFRLVKEIDVQPYAHTGAHVQHIKRFSLDIKYYDHYIHDDR